MISKLALLLLCGSCTDDGGPRLASVNPVRAPRNAIVTLEGTRFCSGDCGDAAGEVLLGLELPQIRAIVVTYDDTTLTLAVPGVAPIGMTELVLVEGGRSSNALPFEVIE